MGNWKKYSKILLYNLLVVWLLMEVVLRTAHFDYLKSYSEKNKAPYLSPFPDVGTCIYYINSNSANKCISKPQPEFNYPYCFNNEGLRDYAHARKKPAKTKRYIALGDSFTEGVGAPVDSTWWMQLQELLNASAGDSVKKEFIGAGTQGSDVFYCYTLLRDKLIAYQPDVVFYMLNYSDLMDITVRGGRDRFSSDTTVKFRKPAPWWLPVYAKSFVVRAIIYHLVSPDYLFRSEQQVKSDEKYAIREICAGLDILNQYCNQRGIKFVAILQPHHQDVIYNKSFLQKIAPHCKASNIATVNLFQTFQSFPRDSALALANKYYWPIDGHCNSEGYRFFAQEIYKHAKEW